MDQKSTAKRVFIVEDDVQVADLIRVVLEDEGYSIAVCRHGDCVDAIRRFQPSAVLCDHMLPICSGATLVQNARRCLDPSIPIIMMSAAPDAAREWRTWGADDFLAKPFELDRLIRVVSRATGEDALRWSTAQPTAGEEAS
jgi:DNA-binding response OmpR family regulator